MTKLNNKPAGGRWINIRNAPTILTALRDMRTLLTLVGLQPTRAVELIPGPPAYVGFCDASGTGAGGVWLSHDKPLQPFVWRAQWSPQIKQDFSTRKLSINNLECASLLLQLLALECLKDISFLHL